MAQGRVKHERVHLPLRQRHPRCLPKGGWGLQIVALRAVSPYHHDRHPQFLPTLPLYGTRVMN